MRQASYLFSLLSYFGSTTIPALPYPSFFANGQKLDGIGKIRIGASYQEVLAAIDLPETKLIDLNTSKKKVEFLDLYDNNGKSYLLKYDSLRTPKEVLYQYDLCTDVKKVIIAEYKVSNLNIGRIKLKFYMDTLINIYISNPTYEFIEALKTKYGDGKTTVEKKEVKCTSIYGDSSPEETTFTTNWNDSTDNILSTSCVADYRDDQCKRQVVAFFEIRDKGKELIRAKCSMEALKRQTETEKLQKKKDLNDL